jgi:2'-5' RNA ligase
MRLFIAIVPPQKTVDNLMTSVGQLQRYLTAGRVVRRENLHGTLCFLGEVSDSDVMYVQSAMDGVKNSGSFNMSVAQISTLGGANIVCAKYKADKRLFALYDTLKGKLGEYGFNVEGRVYRPHTTLVRQFRFDMPFSEVVKNVDVYNVPFEVGSIVLFQSVTTERGVVYERLYEVGL